MQVKWFLGAIPTPAIPPTRAPSRPSQLPLARFHRVAYAYYYKGRASDPAELAAEMFHTRIRMHPIHYLDRLLSLGHSDEAIARPSGC